jgi:hypothetical protein
MPGRGAACGGGRPTWASLLRRGGERYPNTNIVLMCAAVSGQVAMIEHRSRPGLVSRCTTFRIPLFRRRLV